MKWTDPNIKLIAAGSSNFRPGSDWVGWNRTVLEFLKPHADYLAIHLYVGNRDNDYERFRCQFPRTRPAHQDRRRHHRRRAVRRPATARSTSPGTNGTSGTALAGPASAGRRILEERYNLEDALVVATFLNSFVNHAHIVKIANMAQLVNVIAPIFTNDKGLFLQTIYYPLQLFAQHTRGKALQLFVDSPKYKTQALRRRAVPRRLRRLRQRLAGAERGEPPSRPAHRSRIRSRRQEVSAARSKSRKSTARTSSRKTISTRPPYRPLPRPHAPRETNCATGSRPTPIRSYGLRWRKLRARTTKLVKPHTTPPPPATGPARLWSIVGRSPGGNGKTGVARRRRRSGCAEGGRARSCESSTATATGCFPPIPAPRP